MEMDFQKNGRDLHFSACVLTGQRDQCNIKFMDEGSSYYS